MWNKDAKIDATCPKCKTAFVITGQQLIDKETVPCPGCGIKMDLSKVLKDIEDTIKKHRFHKTIDIKFKL